MSNLLQAVIVQNNDLGYNVVEFSRSGWLMRLLSITYNTTVNVIDHMFGDTGYSFATGYSKTADHYTAKRGDWYSGR